MKNKFSKYFNAITLVGLLFFVFANGVYGQEDFAKYVNPFVGTGGHGHTFPGATVPFGFVQLSPDTRVDNWDGSGGYHYSDDIIYGFSHTHLSGTGIPDYCDILFAPYVADENYFEASPGDTKTGYASEFSHKNETAEPGYYSVVLEDENILAEMTATRRVGFHRYTFPEKTSNAKITLDLKWRDEVLDSKLEIVGNNRVEGFRRSSSWAKDQVVYFAAEFSKPFVVSKTKKGEEIAGPERTLRGRNLKSVFSFDVEKGEQVQLKVAISPVSIEGARKNLKAELNHWDFEKVRRDAKRVWNKELSKIEVSGGTKAELTNFYTALYHTMIAPNIFQDVDGKYRGLDKRVHIAKTDTNYTIFSLWDTFRATHPLYTIIDQKRTVDFINTFIRHYEQGGKLPVWELAANETDTMIGYHAVPVIADAIMKGIKGFDYEKAFRAAMHSAELNHAGLGAYRKRGYISMEDENESVSKTLEYAYDDHCIAQMALLLAPPHYKPGVASEMQKFREHLDLALKYDTRSRSYENLFDPKSGFMRPKRNGGFVGNFEPQEVTFHFTEGNSWVYTFFVPHDIPRLIDLLGGKDKFAKKLDQLFTTRVKLSGRFQPDITGLIGQYAHGNEPSHHIAYLYNYADQPWKTQKYVRKIMDEFYRPTPDGLIGNEDCGQMSAWYVLSASGFYEVSPDNGQYVFGTPLFKEVRYKLENGKTFTVKAPNVSPRNIYIKSAKLNGVKLTRPVIDHDKITAGATLEFEMSDVPVTDAFGGFRNQAVDRVNKAADKFVAVPLINGTKRTFAVRNSISLATVTEGAKIYYTTDGSTPTTDSRRYNRPFTIRRTSDVKAIAVNEKGDKSQVAEASFNKRPNDWTVRLFSKYSSQYTGGGPDGLIDGIRGTTNFASGAWQGYQGQDFVSVIDLKRQTRIRELGGGFLQVARSWIWMPTKIEFEVSKDGTNFEKAGELNTGFPEREMTHTIKDYVTPIEPTLARFVRVKAVNLGKIPAWHPGAGFEAYIFVDEIFIR